MSSEVSNAMRLEVACDLEDLAGAAGLRLHHLVAGPSQRWARWFGDHNDLIPTAVRTAGLRPERRHRLVTTAPLPHLVVESRAPEAPTMTRPENRARAEHVASGDPCSNTPAAWAASIGSTGSEWPTGPGTTRLATVRSLPATQVPGRAATSKE